MKTPAILPETGPPQGPLAAQYTWRTLLALAGLLLLALLLRAYRISELSVWYDENNFVFLPAPDLHTYKSAFFAWAPDNLPLYYYVFYFWCHFWGISLATGRMLSIVCGLASVFLTFQLGRKVAGPRAGWIAGFCAACSPSLLWHDQSMRPYAMCIPLALFGVYSLIKISEGAPRWWLALLAANLTLFWIHAFMAFLVPVQCLFLLGTRPHGFRRAAGWAIASAVLLVPPFLWMLPRLPYVPEAEFDHMYSPSFSRIALDMAGDDVMRYSGEFPVTQPLWSYNIPYYESFWGPALGVALMLVLGMLCLRAIPVMRAQGRNGGRSMALIFGIAFLPLAILIFLSFAWRPCLEARYTPYGPIALYILAGAAIAGIRKPILRRAITGLLFLLLLHETVFFMFGGSHTAWNPVARKIQAEQRPEDIILVKGVIPWAPELFRANQLDHAIPLIPAYTIEAVCQKAAAFFAQQPESEIPENSGRVWVVIEMPFFNQSTLEDTFAGRFEHLGLEKQYFFYPGMQNMLLCCFARTAAAPQPAVAKPATPAVSYTDYEALLGDLGLDTLHPEEKARAIDGFRKIVDIPVPFGKNSYLFLSLLLSEEYEYDLAERCALRAISFLPSYGPAYFALGLARAAQGNPGSAMEAFNQAFAMDPLKEDLYGPLMRALYEKPNQAVAEREIKRLSEVGFPYATLRRLFLMRFPQGTAPDTGMGSRDPSHLGQAA